MVRTRTRVVALALPVVLAVWAGCSPPEPSGAAHDQSASGIRESAAPEPEVAIGADSSARPHAEGIVPGSYDDWCEEHAVPETKCTRCDAALIAAFKATGDWCQDHGLPRSQCRTCDPTLVIARAPKPETP
jgi:hypothetical protein